MNIIQDDVKPDVANAEEEEDMGNESEAASCKSVGKSHLPKTWLLPYKIFTEFNNFLKVNIAAKYKVFAMKYFINWKIYMNVQFRFMYITGKLKKKKIF